MRLRWPPPPWPSICVTEQYEMRGSRLAASPPNRGAPAMRSGVSPPAGRVLSLLQDREVRYNGEPIAIVVAESFEEATHAAFLVRVTYRAATPAVDMLKALPSAQPYTQKILGQFEPASRRGDVGAALQQADARI